MEEINNVKNICVSDLDINEEAKEILINAGYQTVGEIIAHSKEDICSIFIKKENYKYKHLLYFWELKAMLHYKLKVGFHEEYKELGLKYEIAFMSLMDLNLSKSIIGILNHRLGIYTLGDLLEVECGEIAKARNMGKVKLQELKKCVHSLGYKLKNEDVDYETIKKSMIEQGKVLLENIFSPRTYLLLYRNNIYTIEDLLNTGSKVYKIKGFGKSKQEELNQKLAELNLSLPLMSNSNGTSLAFSENPTELSLQQAEQDNQMIRKRLEKKQELLLKYKKLIEERNKLLAQEQELDKKLESLKEEASCGRK